ncbi:MAG: hypothetical protein VX341_11760 [Bdellovibrionota bacterium]|nr:hypothetical protein [Bdellovibrionota bacterium]
MSETQPIYTFNRYYNMESFNKLLLISLYIANTYAFTIEDISLEICLKEDDGSTISIFLSPEIERNFGRCKVEKFNNGKPIDKKSKDKFIEELEEFSHKRASGITDHCLQNAISLYQYLNTGDEANFLIKTNKIESSIYNFFGYFSQELNTNNYFREYLKKSNSKPSDLALHIVYNSDTWTRKKRTRHTSDDGIRVYLIDKNIGLTQEIHFSQSRWGIVPNETTNSFHCRKRYLKPNHEEMTYWKSLLFENLVDFVPNIHNDNQRINESASRLNKKRTANSTKPKSSTKQK